MLPYAKDHQIVSRDERLIICTPAGTVLRPIQTNSYLIKGVGVCEYLLLGYYSSS